MDKIEKLTAEQEAYLPIFREEWLRTGLKAGAENKELAESTIYKIYEMHNLKTPQILWFDSPVSCNAIINLFNEDKIKSLLSHLEKDGRTINEFKPDDYVKVTKKTQQEYINTYFYGQLDSYWIAFYKFCEHIGVKYNEESKGKLNLMADLAKSAFKYYFYENFAIVSRRPIKISIDNNNVLHCEDGPSVEFKDGFKSYNWHGTLVPAWIIEEKNLITHSKIMKEENAEVRRCMIEIYGVPKFVMESKASLISSDKYGELYEFDDKDFGTLKVIKVINSTPEPDGTSKIYMLRAHPDSISAHDAIARSFGKTVENYNPIIET